MTPGEKNEKKLPEDVGGCDVEVVFKGSDRHVTVYLSQG